MKKRIVSMLLALTLVVSGMPVGITAEGVNAAEISESEIVAESETEETESAVENKDVYETEVRLETEDAVTFNVSGDGKAVGSDGVAYENVAYLSADTVKTFGAEGQSTYIEICDQIAEEKNAGDYLESAVIAVDEEGNLIFHFSVSMKALSASMKEFTENVFEGTDAVQSDEMEDDDVQTIQEPEEFLEEEVTEEIKGDDNLEEDAGDKSTDEELNTEAEADSETETSSEEISVDKEELFTEENEVNSTKEDDDLSEENVGGETTVSSEENLTEESGTVAKESVLTAENMELIYEPEIEEFEIVENAKADIVIDLGFSNIGGMQQFNSLFPEDGWFSKQLTTEQQKIFNAAKILGNGKNTFTFSGSSAPDITDIYRAVSAYMITEPYKCDWMSWADDDDLEGYHHYLVSPGKKTYKYTSITMPKSKYYNAKLQKEANAKVLEIAAEAQEYAAAVYPKSPVYGIVKYFDKWICEHNYYDMRGVLGGSAKDDDTKKAYYYCHSSYGILLEGYGVCEGYALAMTRLLDSVGIPNVYATGVALDENAKADPKNGHAWNYVGMPDGNWYLQDSTWNDIDVGIDPTKTKVDSPSTEEFLLCADDTNQPNGHMPDGNRWGVTVLKSFTFPTRSASKYAPAAEKIILSLKDDTASVNELNLLAKKSKELTYDNGQNAYIMNDNIPKVWASSNEKVAKVDKNGKVTAVAPGSAEITLTAAGITATCKVNVHQINSITFDEGGKASLATSCGIVSGSTTKETQHISLTINQKAEKPVYTAEELNQKGVFDDFDAKAATDGIVTISKTIEGNKIDLAITPVKEGKTKITVTFGAKKATLNVSVGKMLNPKWFDLTEIDKLRYDEKKNSITQAYTGKAYKPKVVLSKEGKDEKVKFKVSYLNNKDAGTASVIITGTGAYGGKLVEQFVIEPLVLDVDMASVKVPEKHGMYNGGVNLIKSTVKHKAVNGDKVKLVGLKAGKDYEIQYTDKKGNMTTQPTEAGEYTMAIVGIGNYSGGANTPKVIPGKTWVIDPIDIKKVKVTVKVNGRTPDITVAIGKNVLSNSDYSLTYWKDKDCKEPVSVMGGKTIFAKNTKYFVKVEGGKSSNITNVKPIIKNFKTK